MYWEGGAGGRQENEVEVRTSVPAVGAPGGTAGVGLGGWKQVVKGCQVGGMSSLATAGGTGLSLFGPWVGAQEAGRLRREFWGFSRRAGVPWERAWRETER